MERRKKGSTGCEERQEIALLLEVILDEPPGMARLAASWITSPDERAGAPALSDC